MKRIFYFDNMDDIEIKKKQKSVTITLIDEDTGNRYVLEVPLGEPLRYLAETLMFHYLSEQQMYEQLEQECDF